MSRVGRKPVPIPDGVEVKKEDGILKVKGPKGELTLQIKDPIDVEINNEKKEVRVTCRRPNDRKARALWGTTRQLINNMVIGVTQGYVIELDIVGLGYKAEMQGNKLVLKVGYSHDVIYEPPPDVKVGLRSPIRIFVEGIDKQKVGQVAAEIRAIKPPDAYKGAGIRYADEVLHLKPGKSAKGGKK